MFGVLTAKSSIGLGFHLIQGHIFYMTNCEVPAFTAGCVERDDWNPFHNPLLLGNMYIKILSKTDNWAAAEWAIMDELCSDSSH